MFRSGKGAAVRGIVAWFDPATEDRMAGIWAALTELGVPAPASPARPHVSLLVADHIDEEAALAALPGLRTALDVSIGAVAMFPPAVLHLPVTPTRALLELQASVSDAVGKAARGVDRFYLPPLAWQPHCTLAVDVPAALIAGALLLARDLLPMRARLEAMGLEEAGTHRRWPIRPRDVGC